MRRGFIITITVFVLLIPIALYLQSLSSWQASELDVSSTMLAGIKTAHTWEDVDEDIGEISDVKITKENQTIAFEDVLPARYDIEEMLDAYEEFITAYYETPALPIKFLSPEDAEIELEDIPSRITILPFGITYGYPDFGKNELNIKSPVANLSAIKNTTMTVFVNTSITDTTITWYPYKACRAKYYCLNFSFSVTDGNKTLISDKTSFDSSRQSQAKISCVGACWVRVSVGEPGNADPQNVVTVELQNAGVNTTTTLYLNTSDFYITYPAKLLVYDINHQANKTDWI
jgi:hypothetical protein